MAAIDQVIAPLLEQHAARLLALRGVGPEVAGALLVVAGDNPERLRSEASFAALCGVTPLPASSGKVKRHRLNRGGDRRGNTALWRIAMTRLTFDERTRDYVRRRTTEGMSKREILRCLKRYIAREVFRALPGPALDTP
jgi:transposase